MKALIRNPGETVTEAYNIPGIDWDNGMPLTCSVWAGGPYTLVSDYVPKDPVSDFTAPDPVPEPAQDPVVEEAVPTPAASQDPAVEEAVPDTIVIDGVTYTRMS